MSLILQKYLQHQLPDLNGIWVSKPSSYETELCNVLGVIENKGRYWDAKWNDYLLEFKKGKSIWLDLVRYSEVLLQENENACLEVFSLFFIPDRERIKIEEIVCVETYAIIEKINLTSDYAKILIELNSHVPRQFNAQASLTVNDLRQIQLFSVKN